MSETVFVVRDWLGEESWPVAVFTEREFAEEYARSRGDDAAPDVDELPLYRGRALPQPVKVALALLLWLMPMAASAQPTTFPAGATIFAVDVTTVGPIAATGFQLELDGTVQPLAPAGTFTTGEFHFPSVNITGGVHTARARACTDWGADLGGVLCSTWTAPLTFTALSNSAPNVPDGFRIDQVIIVVGPQP